MSNAPAQPGTLSAILVLDDTAQMAGEISTLLDGRLQLEGVEAITQDSGENPVSATAGTTATLSITDAGDPDLRAIQVRIAEATRDCITLELPPAEGDKAARIRKVIAQRCDAQPNDADNTDAAIADTATPDHDSPVVPRAESRRRSGSAKSNPTIAASARYSALLEVIEKQSLRELELALKRFMDDLEAYLLDISSKIRCDAAGNNNHYTAYGIIFKHKDDVTQRIVQQITDYYRDLTPQQKDDLLWHYNVGSAEELDVIDLEEFDDYLAIDRMVTLGEDLHSLALEALTIRLATLIDADPDNVRLPMHVRQLCRSFQAALAQQRIPQIVLPHIFDYFAKRFLRQLSGYYEPLNALLADAAVRPRVETEIQAKGSLLKRNRGPDRPQRTPPEPKPKSQDSIAKDAVAGAPGGSGQAEMDQLHQQIGEQLHSAMGNAGPADLYRSVVDALNFKRAAEGLADGSTLERGATLSGTWEGATVAATELDQSKLADAQAIAKALSALQRDSQARQDVQKANSLRAYLASNKEQLGALQDTSGLTADSLNQLDLVDNLFGTIKSQLDVSAELKPALGNLQIPLAKLALVDPRFFVDHSHTARAVVDKLSHLATAANFPNKALEGRINGIIEEIIADYESDASVFDEALTKIDKLVAQQERALTRNKERVVRTQEGQQTLSHARRAANRLISARIKPPAAPRILQELMDTGWRDLLVLTYVKEGPDSPAWAEQIRTLDLLCSWLDASPEGDGEGEGDVRMQRGLEAEPLIDLIGQQISVALPTNIAHETVLEELREILAGNLETESVAVHQATVNTEPEPEEVRARVDDLPRLRRWVQRVEQLQIDSWLTYRDRKTGQKKRMQLAWISDARDRYIFVNERGQKIADLSAVALARQLSQGVQPPAPTDKLSVVDQSMYHTLEHVQKTLSFARNHDSLTKLINRDTFLDQVRRAMRHSQVKDSQHAVLYLNIDQFALVNDIYDRVSGDGVLLEFAKLLAQLHGKKSSSARLEGDEFAVLLLDRSMDEAMHLAEKVRRDIESSSVDIEGENVSFTVSIGVAAILEHCSDADQVLDSARTAMTHAKQQGRNQVMRYEEERSNAALYKLEKSRTRADLEKALATDRFVLRAQPIVQTAVSGGGDTTLHYELLLGLSNKDGTLSSPEEFIASAERYGFMPLVDRWVVREAFKWISLLMDEQKVVPNLAINLSGSSVTDNSFMDYLLEAISEFGVGTSRLCFEITETGTIANLVKAADFVRAFRNIGCKFSIDDFGTGLASHHYLRELPVDYVKIDGSFIRSIDTNRNDYAMARSINDLAHFLGQETIAESVENDKIIAKLEEIGVDYLQGWGVGRPKLLEDVTADLSNLEQ